MILVPMHVGMKGFYRLRTIDKFSGKNRIDTGWFPNILLDSGLEEMAVESNFISACQVGIDGTDPTPADTGLLGYHAGTTDVRSTVHGRQGSAPYYGWKRTVYRFAVGTVAANLSEVGVGWNPANGSYLISRAKILDPVLQTPTTITPLASEMLEVLYELRYYPPLVDAIGPQVTLNGVVYDTITRASSITGDRWSASIGSKLGQYSAAVSDWRAYDGDLGTTLQEPSGTPANCDNSTQSDSGYIGNSQEIVMNCSCGISGWNLGAGIRSIRIRTTAGDYQTQFNGPADERVPKTTDFTMQMAWTLSWAEKV